MNIYRGKRLRKEYPKDEINVVSDTESKVSNIKMDDDEWYSIEKIYPAHSADKYKIIVEKVKFKG